MKRLFVMLMLWSGFAQATTFNHVWIPFPGAHLEASCRALWTEYDNKHGTKTIFFVKPGSDGIIAIQDMLNFNASRKFICGGSNMVTSNALIHPETNAIDRLEVLIQTKVDSMFWYVPNNNQARNYQEMIAYWKTLNRPINIGVFFASQRVAAVYLERTHNIKVNLVTYRSGPQMYPDLASGSLDLAFDAGGAYDLVLAEGKFRFIGYVSSQNHEGLSRYQNFRSVGFPPLPQWQGIIVPTDLDKELKQRVHQELRSIVLQQSYQEQARRQFATITAAGQPEMTNLVLQQRKLFEQYFK